MHGHGLIQLESKMKKIFMMVLLIFTWGYIYAQSDFNENDWYDGEHGFKCIHFYKENKVEFSDFGSSFSYDLWNGMYKYTASGKKGMYKIKLDNGREFSALVSKYYLVLYEAGENEPYFVGGVGISVEATYPIYKIESSSFLTEKNISYTSKNLDNLNLDSPWVEGVEGYGIGETLTLKTNMPGIAFFSGYFSMKNPSLYEKNSRVKKVRFTYIEGKRELIWNFEDTAGGQQIDLSELFKYDGKTTATIVMEILEVYKGTKYADTCINSMFTGFSHISE